MSKNLHKENTETADTPKDQLRALARLLAKQVARELLADEEPVFDTHGNNSDQVKPPHQIDGDR